jgi:hypothetical protein
VYPSGPLEIRALETLSSGPLSAVEVALRTGESEPAVTEVLEQSVVEQSVTRIKLSHAAAYSLTPKGLYAIAVHQGAQEAPGVESSPAVASPVDIAPVDAAPVDLEAAPSVTGEYDVVRDAPEVAVPEVPQTLPTGIDPVFSGLAASRIASAPAPGRVRWRHVAYAAAYVLLGLFILLFLHSVVGVLAILAGLGLGAWTLRPLLAHDPSRAERL